MKCKIQLDIIFSIKFENNQKLKKKLNIFFQLTVKSIRSKPRTRAVLVASSDTNR